MTFMNYKCQPVALDLEQTINVLAWRMLEEEHGQYLMNWDQKLKYSSAVTKQNKTKQNFHRAISWVKARTTPWGKTICYFQPHGDRIFNLCWSLRELGGQMF